MWSLTLSLVCAVTCERIPRLIMPEPFEILRISEILAVILDGLQDDKKLLYHMSCCCRAFTDPALDILWRSMHSFAPFTLLIPQSASFVNVSVSPHVCRRSQSSLYPQDARRVTAIS
ncbi:hypothetical protein F4604DRAFT_294469 [Suillus subluteus]|nr:hypothetical protein F4604DRAFT_294469 [Suillus subluteus]